MKKSQEVLSLCWTCFMYVCSIGSIQCHCIFAKFTKVEHVVPALTEDVPGFGKQLVKPLWHCHGEQRHHKHVVDAANETLGFFRNDLIQAANSGLKQY